jgi:hypothetical protein
MGLFYLHLSLDAPPIGMRGVPAAVIRWLNIGDLGADLGVAVFYFNIGAHVRTYSHGLLAACREEEHYLPKSIP